MSEKFRIEKLIDYITNIIEELNSDYLEINADWLGIEANNYSIDKIPTDSNVEGWIIPCSRKRDVYTLRSRENYSSDLINNLQNIGFFETIFCGFLSKKHKFQKYTWFFAEFGL